MSFRLRERRNLVSFERLKVVRADFGSGLIRPRAQTCMDSKVVRAVFWHLTDLPPGSNMLRLAYADSGSACKLAGVQIIPLPT